MYPYIVLVAAPILCAIVLRALRVAPRTGDRISLGVFFTLLLALLMLRAPTIGRDLPNYRIFFQNALNKGWNSVQESTTERGFMVLNVLVAKLTDSYQVFLAVIAVLTLVPIAVSYLRNAEDAVLTILLFLNVSVFIILFSTLRQALTMALGLIAYEFIKSKKWYFFLPTVALAFFIHKSALILLVLYPLYHIRISRRWLIGIAPAYVLLFVFKRQIFSLCLRLIASFYENYVTIEDTGAYNMLLLLLLLTAFAYLVPDERRIDRETAGLRNILLLVVAIQTFAPLHTLAMRMNYYFLVFVPLLIPRLIACRKQTERSLRDGVPFFAGLLQQTQNNLYVIVFRLRTKRLRCTADASASESDAVSCADGGAGAVCPTWQHVDRGQLALLAKYVMIAFFLVYFFISAPRQNLLDTFPYRFFWEV